MAELESFTLLTTREVAQRCGVQPSTVTRWLKAGDLAYVRLGRENRIAVADLISYIEERKQRRSVAA